MDTLYIGQFVSVILEVLMFLIKFSLSCGRRFFSLYYCIVIIFLKTATLTVNATLAVRAVLATAATLRNSSHAAVLFF